MLAYSISRGDVRVCNGISDAPQRSVTNIIAARKRLCRQAGRVFARRVRRAFVRCHALNREPAAQVQAHGVAGAEVLRGKAGCCTHDELFVAMPHHQALVREPALRDGAPARLSNIHVGLAEHRIRLGSEMDTVAELKLIQRRWLADWKQSFLVGGNNACEHATIRQSDLPEKRAFPDRRTRELCRQVLELTNRPAQLVDRCHLFAATRDQ